MEVPGGPASSPGEAFFASAMLKYEPLIPLFLDNFVPHVVFACGIKNAPATPAWRPLGKRSSLDVPQILDETPCPCPTPQDIALRSEPLFQAEHVCGAQQVYSVGKRQPTPQRADV